VSEHPWPDDEERAAVLAAEAEPADPEGPSVVEEDVESPPESPGDVEATGITSHVFTREGNRAFSKSTFKLPSTTSAVWTRVAFYDGNGARLVLSKWVNRGSGNPYQTFIYTWYFDHPRARRALVLWFMNGDTWRSWAPR
jgi:hypothetical protein